MIKTLDNAYIWFLSKKEVATTPCPTDCGLKHASQRAQIISHDHPPHFECSECQYQRVPLSTKFQLSSMFTEFYIQSTDSFIIVVNCLLFSYAFLLLKNCLLCGSKTFPTQSKKLSSSTFVKCKWLLIIISPHMHSSYILERMMMSFSASERMTPSCAHEQAQGLLRSPQGA